MDRRQLRGVAWLLLALVGFLGESQASEPVPSLPTPAVTPTAAPVPTPAVPATPASSPAPAPVKPTPKPALPGPLVRPLPTANPRPLTGVLGSNPRPWEWRSWSHEEHQEKDLLDKAAITSEPAGVLNNQVLEPEDSAAVRRLIEQLPPEERPVFTRNFKRWAQMTAEERQTLRRQAGERRQRMEEEMEGALRQSGLHLDNDRREVFMLRYGQERRRLERDLQEKIAAERARRTPEIIERLKREFEVVPAATPTPLP